MMPGGAYSAERAAALSGVPLSTVHYWARTDILVPGVSPERVKLWSFADLLALRTIYWLRQEKKVRGWDIPRTTMPTVRRALAALKRQELEVFPDDRDSTIVIDRKGKIFIRNRGAIRTTEGQHVLDLLDLIAPFETAEGLYGPDLRRPRPLLRIVPGKLGGSPHVRETRLETEAIAALGERGFSVGAIRKLYPFVLPEAIDQAIDLERQLARNVLVAA